MSDRAAILERMFEGLSDWDLIEVMGEATRDESTAIAQRLAAVGVLYSRRERERAECKWWSVDATDAVAAEVSAVQNISHAPGGGPGPLCAHVT